MAEQDHRKQGTDTATGGENKINLADLLPHSADMCLLEEVLNWDKDSISCLTNSHRERNNPLRHEGQLPVIAGIEYAAQAMAIHGTLKSHRQKRPRMGVLAVLSAVHWHIDRLDQLTQALHIKAVRINELAQGACYRFQLHCNGDPLLHGEAVIALQGD